MSDKSGSNREARYTVCLAELVHPLAERLDIVEENVKHCILVDVAVQVLIATLVGNQCLIVQRRDLELLDRSRLDGVTCSRNEEHCVCEIRWIIVAEATPKHCCESYIEGTNPLKVTISQQQTDG